MYLYTCIMSIVSHLFGCFYCHIHKSSNDHVRDLQSKLKSIHLNWKFKAELLTGWHRYLRYLIFINLIFNTCINHMWQTVESIRIDQLSCFDLFYCNYLAMHAAICEYKYLYIYLNIHMYIYILAHTNQEIQSKSKYKWNNNNSTLRAPGLHSLGLCMRKQSKCLNSYYCACFAFALLHKAAVDADAGCRRWQRWLSSKS